MSVIATNKLSHTIYKTAGSLLWRFTSILILILQLSSNKFYNFLLGNLYQLLFGPSAGQVINGDFPRYDVESRGSI